MIETHGKLLIASFMTILLGIVLIQPIADDVESISTGQINIPNETVALSSVTGTVINESVTLNQSTGAINRTIAQLANDQLITYDGLINATSEGTRITGFCNVSLSHGTLSCNGTRDTAAFINYTYTGSRSGALSHTTGDIVSIASFLNVTSENIRGYCNMTLATGAIVCNNTKNGTGYCNYDYEPSDYIEDGTTRTLLGTTRLFFAIAVLIIGIGFAIAALKKSNLI